MEIHLQLYFYTRKYQVYNLVYLDFIITNINMPNSVSTQECIGYLYDSEYKPPLLGWNCIHIVQFINIICL